MKVLSELAPEEQGVVERVEKCSLSGRLTDMGIIPGTKIKCITKSPLGNPTAFLVRGTLLSLRNEDAENIILE